MVWNTPSEHTITNDIKQILSNSIIPSQYISKTKKPIWQGFGPYLITQNLPISHPIHNKYIPPPKYLYKKEPTTGDDTL